MAPSQSLLPVLAVALASALGAAAGAGFAALLDFPHVVMILFATWWGLSTPIGMLVGYGCSIGENEAA